MQIKKFGLIGKNLSHSYSPGYFQNKWQSEERLDCQYQIFEVENEQKLEDFLNQNLSFVGFNVTIPYKQQILPFLSKLSLEAEKIGAVNCIKQIQGQWIGHNTDGPAFLSTLDHFLPDDFSDLALILGSGGSSKAVQWALSKRKIKFELVSSTKKGRSYSEIRENWNKKWRLIINTTPVGMFPIMEKAPELLYSKLTENSYVYDLIYNPAETLFLKTAKDQGAKIKNGLEMLKLQADLSFDFWNSKA